MRISAKTKFCLIIGNPVEHSLSPKMHNAGYEAIGIDHQFVYLGSQVKVENVKTVIAAMRVMKSFRGLACTIPHKIEVVKYLDWIDPIAKKIGAVNTVVNDGGILKGFNTDWLGVVIPLEKILNLKRKKVAVLGAGGAARAIAYGMLTKKAQVTIFNRTVKKAETLAKEFNCQGMGLEKAEKIRDFDIVINSTSVGMCPMENETPIPAKFITNKQIVFDIIYAPFTTRFLKEARKKGAKIIHGFEMLLHQGTAQFELFTERKAPENIMRKTILNQLKVKNI